MAGRWVDLSQAFYTGMPHSRALICQPCFEVVHTHQEHVFQATRYTLLTHVGTHVDAPLHFLPGARPIDEVPLDRVAGVGVVLDIPRAAFGEIGPKDLERGGPVVGPGDIVMIRTGFGARYGTADDYLDHPHLTEEAAAWLVDRGAKLVGVDFNSPDQAHALRGPGFRWPVHHILLERGVLIVEHLNLEGVRPGRMEFCCFPVKFRGADGAPARVVARALP
jgi:kynurenine formamidase